MKVAEVLNGLTEIIDGKLYHIDDIREIAEWAKLHLLMYHIPPPLDGSLDDKEGR